jgi:hypothetical protein
VHEWPILSVASSYSGTPAGPKKRELQVIAQDQSEAQLENASHDESNMECQHARAEETGLPNACADLVTTAQALHW